MTNTTTTVYNDIEKSHRHIIDKNMRYKKSGITLYVLHDSTYISSEIAKVIVSKTKP